MGTEVSWKYWQTGRDCVITGKVGTKQWKFTDHDWMKVGDEITRDD